MTALFSGVLAGKGCSLSSQPSVWVTVGIPLTVSLIALAGVLWTARTTRQTTLDAAEKSRQATLDAAEKARLATLKVSDDSRMSASEATRTTSMGLGRTEWFRRFDAMANLALSEEPKRARLGIGMLSRHAKSDLAGPEEKDLC